MLFVCIRFVEGSRVDGVETIEASDAVAACEAAVKGQSERVGRLELWESGHIVARWQRPKVPLRGSPDKPAKTD